MTQQNSPIKLEREGNVRVERNGHALVITLNRPERLNALSLDMRTQLEEIIRGADADSSVRVLIFTGTGRAFCSGGDVEQQKEQAGTTFEQRMTTRRYYTPRKCKIYKPSICVVNGMCAGAGLHFVADCDIVIASEDARFTDTHVNVGQITAQEPIGLSRRVPLGAVLRMAMLGKAERLTAQEALRVHLVSEVVAPDRLMARALELANAVSEVSPTAVRESLRLIWESYEPQLSEAYERAYVDIMRHRDHPDAFEGPRAFLEKRKPKWTV
jgi:enoyl-CoA hydratase/carnithine racemase